MVVGSARPCRRRRLVNKRKRAVFSRLAHNGIAAFLTTALVFGIWIMLPYFEQEHKRLWLWQIILVWIGDVTALIWFFWFTVKHGVLGGLFWHTPSLPFPCESSDLLPYLTGVESVADRFYAVGWSIPRADAFIWAAFTAASTSV